MKKINIHLISDSTGETLGAMSRAVMSQFKGVESKEYMWSLVRTETKLRDVISKVKDERGIVLYTILSQELLNILIAECRKHNIVAVAALDQVTEEFSKFVGEEVINKPGRQHVLDKEYFERIEAINYTISHDDGQRPEEIDEADMVLVGPSRTSKSPTCLSP